MKTKRILAVVLVLVMALGLCACGSTANSAAQTNAPAASAAPQVEESNWPANTVQLIVAAKAGGGTDLVARVLAEKMSALIGESVVVVNQTEGSGAVAFDTVMNDDEDALQLGFFIPSFFTSYITGSVDMDPLSDFQCASFLACEDANFFVVAADSQFNSMEELIDYAKAHPGELTLGLSLGSRTHFTVAEFANAAGISFKYVEAGNSTDQVTALLGGHIDVTLLNIANTTSYVDAGEMKALSVTGEPAERTEKLKDVPTLAALGYTDLKCKCDFFVIASNQVSAATVEKINATMLEVLADENVRAQILQLGYVLDAQDIATGNAAYEASYSTFDAVGEALGIKAVR